MGKEIGETSSPKTGETGNTGSHILLGQRLMGGTAKGTEVGKVLAKQMAKLG